MRLYLDLEDYKGEEIKFHEEILATLRNLMTEEEKRKILSGISLISSKIVERMEAMTATR